MTYDPKGVLGLIRERRTVRRFDPSHPVASESLRRILEAAVWAPYAPYHPQGWKLIALEGELRDAAVAIVCKTKTVLKYIRKEYEVSPLGGEAESVEEHAWKELARDFGQHLGHAPVVVVGLVPSDPVAAIRGHNLGSAWAAVQNMMLQAQAEGLASGVVTFQSPSVQRQLLRLLDLEEEKWIVAFLLNIGYPLETPQPVPRRKDLYEIRTSRPTRDAAVS